MALTNDWFDGIVKHRDQKMQYNTRTTWTKDSHQDSSSHNVHRTTVNDGNTMQLVAAINEEFNAIGGCRASRSRGDCRAALAWLEQEQPSPRHNSA